MKKLLAVLASAVLVSTFALPAVTGSVALAQDQFQLPDDIQIDIEGEEFDFEIQQEEGQQQAAAAAAAAGALTFVMFMIWLVLVIAFVAVGWVLFSKAGKPGWAAIVPFYNLIVLCEICGRPLWWFILLIFPCVNIVASAIISIDLAKSFGKDTTFGVLMWLVGVFLYLPIFPAILAFGSAQYQGPAAAEGK